MEQVKKCKEKEKLLEEELETLQQEDKRKEKMVRRIWECRIRHEPSWAMRDAKAMDA